MDKFTKKLMESQDSFSDTIINGYAIKQIKGVANFLHKVLMTAQYSVRDPEFKYVSYKLMTPEEELNTELVTYAGKPKTSSINGDVTLSSVRRVKYTFTYKEEPIWIDMYLPIVAADNTMSISNTKYILMPVLTDRIISPAKDHIFIKFYKHKVRLEDVLLTIYKRSTDEDEFQSYSELVPFFPKLYAIRNVTDPLGFNAVTPSALYILAKYGLRGTNAKYGSDVQIITKEQIEEYHKKGYTLYSGSGDRLKGMRMVPKDKNEVIVASKYTDSFSTKLAISIMYTFEAMPTSGIRYVDKLDYWKMTLGLMIFNMNISPEGLMPSVNEHLISLSTYVDTLARESLSNMGYEPHNEFDFFDFTHLLLNDYDKFKQMGVSNSSTVLDKNLDILYYVMFEIILSFNTTFSKINKAIQDKSELTAQDVKDIMHSRFMKTKAIFSISKGTGSILPLVLANNYCDNKIMRMTCLAELQSRGEGVKKKKSKGSKKIPLDVETLNAIDLLYGNVLHLPKSLITPLARLNPYAQFNDAGELQVPDDLKDLLSHIEADLQNIGFKSDVSKELISVMEQNDVTDNE